MTDENLKPLPDEIWVMPGKDNGFKNTWSKDCEDKHLQTKYIRAQEPTGDAVEEPEIIKMIREGHALCKGIDEGSSGSVGVLLDYIDQLKALQTPAAGNAENILTTHSPFHLCNGYPHNKETDWAIDYLDGPGAHTAFDSDKQRAIRILKDFAKHIRKQEIAAAPSTNKEETK